MIGIVGGGIAGLAAAYRLQQHGYDVRVFEAGEAVGGLAASYETRGDPIERFYHHLSASERTIVELAEELGLGDAVEWRVGKNAYYVDGVSHPLDTPWEILAYPHLSLYEKYRLAMLTAGIDVRGLIPQRGAYEDRSVYEDVPVEEFLLEHTTRGVYEYFFEPLLEAKFGDRTADVSAAWLLGRIAFRGERDLLRGEYLGYVDGGFARLLDALIDAIGPDSIETGALVTAVGIDDGVVDSMTVESDDESVTYDVEAVVVATMPTVLESLVGYPCEIDFQGTICTTFGLEESVLDTYWLNIADDAPFGVLIEHTNFVPVERYGGEHLLYAASYVQDLDDPFWKLSDAEVEARWIQGIADLFPSFDPTTIEWIETARNPRTAPVYECGYLDMVVPYDLANEVADGVYYAGMASRAQYPERSLDGGVVAGFTCADLIADGAPSDGRGSGHLEPTDDSPS